MISPNCSLSVQGACLLFASLTLSSMGVAAVMAWHGFWPVLPFAGLEMALLAWALRVSLERRHHRQTITVSQDDVCVESCTRGCAVQVVFPRHWAQVKLRGPSSRLHPSRLVIESHGRQCEVGDFLTENERRGLAMRLKQLIGRINESPRLA
ncbi:MAG TPA: DUF2244 domain-containing protein [Steroidobacteraceae bacterium]|nr:DUF2244 domain-containing protein [Steroidobacteraceae bacterium]